MSDVPARLGRHIAPACWRVFRRGGILFGLTIASAAMGAGHQKPPIVERKAFTAEELAAALPAGLTAKVRLPADEPAAFDAFLTAAPAAAKSQWLVLTSGGDNGAFAAGLLNGWTKAGTRPDFGLVSGISTGALIAPFAFIGAKGDPVLEELYTKATAADVFEFSGTVDGLTDTWPLKRQIARTVTANFLAEVAASHREGRRLLVVTTELDSGRPVLWDMGAIAADGSPAALTLFRAVLLASAAIPGIFPPVIISATDGRGERLDEMHADGSITMPFFLAPAELLQAENPKNLPAKAVYLVVSQRLKPEFQMARRTVLDVLGRSISAAVKAQIAAAIAQASAFAARTGLPLHIAVIGNDFLKTSSTSFDPSYMSALYAYGREVGFSRGSPGSSALPPSATAPGAAEDVRLPPR